MKPITRDELNRIPEMVVRDIALAAFELNLLEYIVANSIQCMMWSQYDAFLKLYKHPLTRAYNLTTQQFKEHLTKMETILSYGIDEYLEHYCCSKVQCSTDEDIARIPHPDVRNMYIAAKERGLLDLLANCYSKSFEYYEPPEIAKIGDHPLVKERGHSGASYGYCMRNVKYIASHGVDAFILKYKPNKKRVEYDEDNAPNLLDIIISTCNTIASVLG